MGCKHLPLVVSDFIFDVILTHGSSELNIVTFSIFFSQYSICFWHHK